MRDLMNDEYIWSYESMETNDQISMHTHYKQKISPYE